MGDWADEKALDLWMSGNKNEGIDLVLTAQALRQVRLDALEEVAQALAAEDERHAEIIVRALKEKTNQKI